VALEPWRSWLLRTDLLTVSTGPSWSWSHDWPSVGQYILVSSPLWDLRQDINSVWILLHGDAYRLEHEFTYLLKLYLASRIIITCDIHNVLNNMSRVIDYSTAKLLWRNLTTSVSSNDHQCWWRWRCAYVPLEGEVAVHRMWTLLPRFQLSDSSWGQGRWEDTERTRQFNYWAA
jgi:hypothetical protein